MKTKVLKRHSDVSSRRGFTLIEVLIVLVIISILMALLFPAFQTAQERGRQANCASNLQQIYMAVNQYKNDEREFPASLAVLMATNMYLDDGTGLPADSKAANRANTYGTGYLKSGSNLLCPNDDKDDVIRSSYGDISTNLATGKTESDDPSFLSRFVWNYWGYDNIGRSYRSPIDVTDAAGSPAASSDMFVTPANAYDFERNPIKNSMSNRYAAGTTIITRCVFHRPQTANNLATPDQLYATGANAPTAADAKGARDIILRLDGSAKPYDVTTFNTPTGSPTMWQTQDFR
ncbi:MAG TPA: type II secretion system protein [Abditibacteriaceae bacterium]|jgi:prepilin-type N-terminal cleavage/methylation domain-containing protein